MQENTKKDMLKNESSLKKEVIVFAVTLLVIVAVIAVPLVVAVVSAAVTGDTPSFIGPEHYFRLIFNDSLFLKALANTFLPILLPMLFGVAVAWILSVLLPLKKPAAVYTYAGITTGLGAVMLVGAWVVKQEEVIQLIAVRVFGADPRDLTALANTVNGIAFVVIFLIAFGICAGVFMWIRHRGLSRISRFFVRFGVLVAIWDSSASITAAVIYLVGYPTTNYAVNSILLSHINTSGTAFYYTTIFAFPALLVPFLMALMLWGVERIPIKKQFSNVTEVPQESAQPSTAAGEEQNQSI